MSQLNLSVKVQPHELPVYLRSWPVVCGLWFGTQTCVKTGSARFASGSVFRVIFFTDTLSAKHFVRYHCLVLSSRKSWWCTVPLCHLHGYIHFMSHRKQVNFPVFVQSSQILITYNQTLATTIKERVLKFKFPL